MTLRRCRSVVACTYDVRRLIAELSPDGLFMRFAAILDYVMQAPRDGLLFAYRTRGPDWGNSRGGYPTNDDAIHTRIVLTCNSTTFASGCW